MNRQQRRKAKRDPQFIYQQAMEAYKKGVQDYRDSVAIELGLGDKRLTRIDERFGKVAAWPWGGETSEI